MTVLVEREIKFVGIARKLGILELILRPLKLQEVIGSLAEAEGLEGESKWGEAAQIFLFCSRKEESPQLKVEALIGLAQMLINLERYKQAEGFLEVVDQQVSQIGGQGGYYFRAEISGKRAWVADGRGDFETSIKELN